MKGCGVATPTAGTDNNASEYVHHITAGLTDIRREGLCCVLSEMSCHGFGQESQCVQVWQIIAVYEPTPVISRTTATELT